MLNDLKFVQGAVAKKDFVPVLQHFRIKDNRIMGFNGNVALSSPIELDIDVIPKALPMIKAIETCKETASIYMTPGGKLAIKSGAFRVYIPCLEEEFPDTSPEGTMIPLPMGILDILTKLKPFIAEDASRPWASGVLFRGQSAFVTNNVILVEHWLETAFPTDLNIPVATIRELLRIKEEPHSIQIADNSVTFHFSKDRWLRSQKSSLEWPDLAVILSKESNQKAIPEGFFEMLENLKPFLDDLSRVNFREGKILTSTHEETGAGYEVVGLPEDGHFNLTQLTKLSGIAKSIDFDAYPAPCLFFGEKLRGAIIGMRDTADEI